jgi:hypothetical protein
MADDFVLVEPTVIRNTHGGRRRGAGHPRGAYKALVTESTEAIQAEVASVGPEIVRQHIGLALKLERYLANGNAKMAKLAVTCGVGLLRFLVPKNNGPMPYANSGSANLRPKPDSSFSCAPCRRSSALLVFDVPHQPHRHRAREQAFL